jgi:DNA invertase Pin-like site-specific DNA recombinase
VAGCEKVFSEKVSSVGQRDQLEAALDYAREGDALVVTKLDRLARSVFHLVAIGERLENKCVSLKVLVQAIDTSTSTGPRSPQSCSLKTFKSVAGPCRVLRARAKRYDPC